MRSMRTVLLGFALAVVLGGIAWSQGDQPGQQLSSFQLKTGTVLFVTPDGTVSRHSDVPPSDARRAYEGRSTDAGGGYHVRAGRQAVRHAGPAYGRGNYAIRVDRAFVEAVTRAGSDP
jgi:hypothetical protein